jgi:hypothetical protein
MGARAAGALSEIDLGNDWLPWHREKGGAGACMVCILLPPASERVAGCREAGAWLLVRSRSEAQPHSHTACELPPRRTPAYLFQLKRRRGRQNVQIGTLNERSKCHDAMLHPRQDVIMFCAWWFNTRSGNPDRKVVSASTVGPAPSQHDSCPRFITVYVLNPSQLQAINSLHTRFQYPKSNFYNIGKPL